MGIFTFDESLKTYLDDNFNDYLEALTTPETNLVSKYFIGYPDTDKHTDKITCYILPFQFDFQREGNFVSATIPFKVYFIFRNLTGIETVSKSYLQYFYDFINGDETLGGLVNMSFISSVKYYDGTEGNDNIKAIENDLTINVID
jgi:hypothetical protein